MGVASQQCTTSLVVPTAGTLEPVLGGVARIVASACQTPFASISSFEPPR